MTFHCTFIIPIRRVEFSRVEADGFARYFQTLRDIGAEILVVDGSSSHVFHQHSQLWSAVVSKHVTPDPKYNYLNGKVNGVHTGVDLASCERIIVADDDIRFTAADTERMCDLLNDFEMVRPQNFFQPLPWWSRIETARVLINRGVLRAGDYPGTCGFRRSSMRRVGPYDGDVLFDNEEIVRHFAVQGASIKYARDFFILKRPPTFRKWMEQRPRQAYEDFVMRAKTFAFLAVFPAVAALGLLVNSAAMLSFIAFVSLLAIIASISGLVRDRAYKVFPHSSPLFAPLWILERSFSVYWAIYWRLRYGGYPFGARLLSKGTGDAWIAGGKMQSRTLAKL